MAEILNAIQAIIGQGTIAIVIVLCAIQSA